MTMATLKFQSHTLANRPSAATFGRGFAIVTDQGNELQYSDGVNWSVVNKAISRPFRLNGLGDSITAMGTYQNTGIYNAPQWQPSTAYVVGNIVANNGLVYRCTVAGISASSGGPTGLSSPTDGTVTWTHSRPTTGLTNKSALNWAEKFSGGQLYIDQSVGITGITGSVVKVIVTNGGSGYTAADVMTISGNGVSVTPVVENGAITRVIVNNPGQPNVPPVVTINSARGTGATFSVVHTPSGTFGVTGCYTSDMVARLPDVVAADVDIIEVHGGTNDITNNIPADTIIANLKTCYETLIAAGKYVIAEPITPKTSVTGVQIAAMHKVNNWIRNYVRSWLATGVTPRIDIADATGFFTDGSSASNAPVGGASGTTPYAVTVDGLHNSARGAMYKGYCIWKAAQRLIGATVPDYPVRSYSQTDGYDPVRNPAGNLFEGAPWTASTAYAVGAVVANDTAPVKVYVCTVAGTSAGSGGPTTTSPSADGGCTWVYKRPAGLSVANGGMAGTGTAAGGIAYVGNIPTGTVFSRLSGTASGTITFAQESPWSNGQVGQRFTVQFSLGSGGLDEIWNYTILNANLTDTGLVNSDRLTNSIQAEVEIELSGVANLAWAGINLQDTGGAFLAQDNIGVGIALGNVMMASSGEMIPYPNAGKMLLRTRPILMPSGMTTVNLQLQFAFAASGGAGTATALCKVNGAKISKAFVS